MSFPVSKIFIHFHLYKFVYVPIYFTNNKNSIRRVIWGFIYTSKIKIHIKDNTWNVIILTIIQKMFAKFDGKKVEFIRIGMYGLVSNENRYIMWENILELQTLITFNKIILIKSFLTGAWYDCSKLTYRYLNERSKVHECYSCLKLMIKTHLLAGFFKVFFIKHISL